MTDEQKWTPEPWSLDSENIHIGSIATLHGDAEGWREIWAPWSGGMTDQNANAERIVTCVNALAGIENPSAVRELVEALKDIATSDERGICDSGYGAQRVAVDALTALDQKEGGE